MAQHQGQQMPANLVPGAAPLSAAQANRAGHFDGVREGTDRHLLNNDQSMKYMQGLFPGLSPIVDKTTQGMDQLGGKTGLVNISFDNLDHRAVALNDNFTGLGTGSGGLKNALDILTATAMGAARALAEVAMSGGGGAGGIGGGSGIINASYGGGGGGSSGSGGWSGNPMAVGSGFGNGSWAKSGAAKPEVADYIKAQAAKLGIDPNVALRVSQSEGFNTYTGDYGTSFGPFQLHYGGSGIRGMNSGGIGDRFTKATGLNARDPKTWKAQVDYALGIAKHEGWGAWHGAAHVGIGNHQGLDYHGPVPTAGAPPRKVSPGKPASAVTAENASPTHIHVALHLDKKVIAREVIKTAAAGGRFPTGMGGPDTHSHYTSPGTPIKDVA